MSFPRTTDVSKHLARKTRRSPAVPPTALLAAAQAAREKAEAERPALSVQEELKTPIAESGK